MKLLRFFMWMIFSTIVSLIYIQLQVQIVELAYQGDKKEKEMRRLNDDNGDVRYNIYRLKSANNLGVKLLTNNSQMKFLDNDHIVMLKMPMDSPEHSRLASRDKLSRRSNFLASIFSLKSQAEAVPIK